MDWGKLLSEKRIRKSSKKNATTSHSDIRNEFESDLGRIIYSPALRRMHDKTQVFPLTTDDNIHTRLTHSNEVMSLGYTFGLKCAHSNKIRERTGKSASELLRIIPLILQSACLIHDIGNPPFGHFAENIISNYFDEIDKNPLIPKKAIKAFKKLSIRKKNDFIHFDGNAQGLRVVTKLQYLDDVFGLNLTYSILGSYLKYPNYYTEKTEDSDRKNKKKENIGQGKHGVFFSEQPYFDKIVKECGLTNTRGNNIRHPLCFLMEAADSIAYRVMDIEDGFSKKYITIENIKTQFSKSKSDISEEIIEICDRPDCNDGNKIVFIRIKLIDYLVNLAFSNFERNLSKIELGNYNKELIDDDPYKIDEILQRLCSLHIFATREINYLETTGYSVITGLLNHYISQVFHKKDTFANRAIPLISCSLRDVSIIENFKDIAKRKYDSITEEKKESFDEEKRLIYEGLTKKNEELANVLAIFPDQDEIDYDRVKRLIKDITSDFEKLGIYFGVLDLDDYYKFRVIVDFISGMTDKFALRHFQKISGQKID